MSDAIRKNVYFPPRIVPYVTHGGDSLSGRVVSIIDRYREIMRRSPPVESTFTDLEQRALLEILAPRIGFDPATRIFDLAIEAHEAGLSSRIVEKIENLTAIELVQLAEWLEQAA